MGLFKTWDFGKHPQEGTHPHVLVCFPLRGWGWWGGGQDRSCDHHQEVFALPNHSIASEPRVQLKAKRRKAGVCCSGPGCVQAYASRANKSRAAKAMETTGHLKAATQINTFAQSFDSFQAATGNHN